ncbi:hypothetical protein BH11ARM1_BH11ARM1_05680 [soil metagenome]
MCPDPGDTFSPLGTLGSFESGVWVLFWLVMAVLVGTTGALQIAAVATVAVYGFLGESLWRFNRGTNQPRSTGALSVLGVSLFIVLPSSVPMPRNTCFPLGTLGSFDACVSVRSWTFTPVLLGTVGALQWLLSLRLLSVAFRRNRLAI